MVKDNSISSKILTVIIHISLGIMLIVTLYPVLHVIAVSFSSEDAYREGIGIIPRDLDFIAYRVIFRAGTVLTATGYSFIYTILGTLINLIMTSTLAFGLSRKRLAFRKIYTIFVMIPMFFSGGLIPSFLLVNWLGIYNKIWALVIPGAISVWNMIVLRTFFQSVPNELDESAYIDGASDIQIFIKIILPVSKAGIATIGLFYAVGHWNSWFSSLVYLSDSTKYPLQMLLRQIVIESQLTKELAAAGDLAALEALGQSASADSIKYATIVVSMVPMLILYPFVQKYFVKGVMIGSIKG